VWTTVLWGHSSWFLYERPSCFKKQQSGYAARFGPDEGGELDEIMYDVLCRVHVRHLDEGLHVHKALVDHGRL
jgi:hypothetical protein